MRATNSPASSLSRRSFSAATDTLLDILQREYDEEKENQNDVMPDELSDLMATIQGRDWKIVDQGATTRLFTTRGARKVQILFHCQDTVEEVEEVEEEEEDDAPAFRFTVTVSKAGKTMVFICQSRYAECFVESVNVTSTDVSLLDNGTPSEEYQGPDYLELASDLQGAFGGYLIDEIGIDEDLCAFIAMYADYKEQNQYMEFLESAKSLLE